MKKIISILLCAFMLHTAALAAPQIVFNNELRTIDISGVSQHKNALLSVIITKKGTEPSLFTQAELIYKLYTDEKGYFEGQFLLPSEGEGTLGGFDYEVYVSGDAEAAEFYLATPAELTSCISDFQSPTEGTIAAAIENNKDVLGVSLEGADKDYSTWTQKTMLELISEQKAENVTEIIDYFNKASEAANLLCGDQQKTEAALSANLLQNTIETEYDISKISEMLLNVRNTPSSDEDITDVIAQNIRVATAIVAINSSTRGKMTEVLEKYNDVLLLDLDGDYASLSQMDVNKGLQNKNFTSLQDIRQAFSDSVTEVKTPTSLTTSDVGGGRGGVGSGGGASAFKPEPTPIPEEDKKAECPFTDLESVSWAKDAISNLYENGIVSGYGNNEFAPSKTVTRAEFTKMIVMVAGDIKATASVGFADVSASDWFAPYVEKAAAAGLVSGMGNTFVPNGEITREDAALIIYRLIGANLNLAEVASFSDESNISDYAREAVKALAGSKIINGMGDGSFSPKTTLTRAQAAVLIYSAMSKLQ